MGNDITNEQVVTMVNRGGDTITKLWKDFSDDDREAMKKSGDFYMLASCEEAEILCIV